MYSAWEHACRHVCRCSSDPMPLSAQEYLLVLQGIRALACEDEEEEEEGEQPQP